MRKIPLCIAYRKAHAVTRNAVYDEIKAVAHVASDIDNECCDGTDVAAATPSAASDAIKVGAKRLRGSSTDNPAADDDQQYKF